MAQVSTADKSPNLVFNDITISEKAYNEWNLNTELAVFMKEEPFYSSVIRMTRRVESTQIPTAGVRANPKELQFELLWNRAFCASRTRNQFRGLIIHECMHLILSHCTTRRKEPHNIWNWATDLAINSFLKPEFYPSESILVPGLAFPPLTPEAVAKSTPEAIEQHKNLSSLIASLPKHQASEWYFGRLMSDPMAIEAIEKNAGKRLKLKDLQVDENGNLTDADGNPVSIMPGPSDDHGEWDENEMTQEERDQMSQAVKDALAKAIREADSHSQGWGSIPAEMQKELRRLVSREIPWQEVLKKFAGFSRSTDRDTSWTKINTKIPGGAVGTKRKLESRVAVFVDMSGSVDDQSLALFGGELESLSGRVQFTFYPFDCEVGEPLKFKRGGFKNIKRTRSGGTDFDAATKVGNALYKSGKIDGFLIMTDGECSKPRPALCRRGWVICPGRKLHFQNEMDPRDILIQMADPKEKRIS
jgi:predicted metal-dependent peptidase